MKQGNSHAIARKYAHAFVRAFYDELNIQIMDRVLHAADFLSQHRRALFFMKLPVIDVSVKMKGIEFLRERFDLGVAVKKLMVLLLKQKRAFLLEKVFRAIVTLYQERAAIESFCITSSHELSKHEIEILQRFLAQQTGHDIIYNYRVDNQLIAGIRMCSDVHLWEYSIIKQLHAIRLPLIR